MTRLTNRLFKETVLGLTAALVVCLAVGAGCSTKSREAEEFCQQGMEQLNQNEVDAAVDSFNKSLELDANVPLAYVGLGEVALRKRDFPTAQEKFNKALELDESLVAALR